LASGLLGFWIASGLDCFWIAWLLSLASGERRKGKGENYFFFFGLPLCNILHIEY